MRKFLIVFTLSLLVIFIQGCNTDNFDDLWSYMQTNGARDTEGGLVSYSIVYPARGSQTKSFLIRVSRDRNVYLLILESTFQNETGVGLSFSYGRLDSDLTLFYSYESRFAEATGYDPSAKYNSRNGEVSVKFNRYQGNNRSRDEVLAEIAAEELIRFTKEIFENRIRIPLR
jgi:hypothetical protein